MRMQWIWKSRRSLQNVFIRRSSQYHKPFWRRPLPATLLGCAVLGVAAVYFAKPSPIDENYPRSVAKYLHEALYRQKGENIHDFQDAWKAYQSAIKQAESEKMDMESPPVQGIRLQMANLLASAGALHKAWSMYWDILERTSKLPDFLEQRVLIASKLIELSEPLGLQKDATKAADLIVKALLSKQFNGDDEQKSRLFEQSATLYFQAGTPSYAVPLYHEALNLTMANPSCHGLILMNNLATSLLAQTETVDKKHHETLMKQSQSWSQKAVDSYYFAYPKDRNQECHAGCAAAFYTLGQIAERQGNIDLALKHYKNSEALRKDDPYNDGSMLSHIAIDRLDKDAFIKKLDKSSSPTD
ncbi:TPR repeat-containing protein P27G11.02 [Schizosaccharomyces pombe]